MPSALSRLTEVASNVIFKMLKFPCRSIHSNKQAKNGYIETTIVLTPAGVSKIKSPIVSTRTIPILKRMKPT